jgi:inner membrane protein
MLPDIDVIAFQFGVPYDSAFAHRGVTHSISFALLCGVLAAVFARNLHSGPWIAFAFVSVATASHGVLDAFTTGGSGIAFLWPFVDERYFMPWQMIRVSPIGLAFFSERGALVLLSELIWVWLPCLVLGGMIYLLRCMGQRKGEYERSRN